MISQNIPYGIQTERAHLLDMMRPDSSDTLPVVIHFHGGGWRMFGKYLTETEFLAKAGFCVVSANYRYAQEAYFPAQFEDVQAVLQFTREQASTWNIDPTRVFAWGISAGAHLAAMLGTDPSSQLSGVACICPPTDFTNPTDWALEYADKAFEWLLGSRADRHIEPAQAASPALRVSSLSAPTLIIHGAKDELVPIQQAEVFDAALRQHGVSSRLVVIPEGDHFINETHMPQIQEEILRFFTELV